MTKTITPKATNKRQPAYLWAKILTYTKMYNITRTELATALGVSPNTVCNYSHSPENMTLKALYNFLSAYHLTLAELENF